MPDTVMQRRKDPLEEAYARAEHIEKTSYRLGWAAVAAFAAYVYFHLHHAEAAQSAAKFAFVSFAVCSVLAGYYLRFVVQPPLDRERRNLLLSDSFDANYTALKQSGYFTSTERPSLRRFLDSLSENTYFYPRLLRHEMTGPTVLVLAMLVGLLFAIRLGTAEVVELFAVLLLFSDLGVIRLIRMGWTIKEDHWLHSECAHALKLSAVAGQRLDLEAMRLYGEYETIKARGGVRASKHTFDKLNPRLTREWDEVRRGYMRPPGARPKAPSVPPSDHLDQHAQVDESHLSNQLDQPDRHAQPAKHVQQEPPRHTDPSA